MYVDRVSSPFFKAPIDQIQSKKPLVPQINCLDDLIRLLPSNLYELERIADEAMHQAQLDIQSILAIKREERTFTNTILAADEAKTRFQDVCYRFEFVLTWLHPDTEIRTNATINLIALNQFFHENFIYNRDLFCAYKDYAEGYGINENLSDTQLYGMHRMINELEKLGAGLSTEKLAELAELKKEIDGLSLQYTQNYNNKEYKPKFTVSKEDLAGLPEGFIDRLARDGENYILTTSIATQVLKSCHIEETRKKMYLADRNKGVPVNQHCLQQILQKYNELALKLGYTSFAHMDTNGTMANSPEEVKKFIDQVIKTAKLKWEEEKSLILENLPASTTLFEDEDTGQMKLKAWDLHYIFNKMKKKFCQFDEQNVKAYFPRSETIARIFSLFEEFMGIRIREVKVNGLWHEDVRALEVYDSKEELCGYMFLDLKKRQNKQGHFCCSTYARGYKRIDGYSQPSACVLTTSLKSQMTHSQVKKFFHEFGHGLHAVLGRNEFAGLCGMFMASDLMEMPSQLLEEWMFQDSVLEKISSHYETGESIPKDLIKSIIKARNFEQGHCTLNEMIYALTSLEIYLNSHEQEDLHSLIMNIKSSIREDILFDSDEHFECAWFHITNPLYLSKYYGYMYSKVIAHDVFDFIQQNGGIFNKVIGQIYIDEILCHGGSKNPAEMLEKFLGRPSNMDAFTKSLNS